MDIITGATGLLGNALIRELLNRGRNVKALGTKIFRYSMFCMIVKSRNYLGMYLILNH